jgi:hypothetical protein
MKGKVLSDSDLQKMGTLYNTHEIGSITVRNRFFHLVENFVDLVPGLLISASLLKCSTAFCCSLLGFFHFCWFFFLSAAFCSLVKSCSRRPYTEHKSRWPSQGIVQRSRQMTLMVYLDRWEQINLLK